MCAIDNLKVLYANLTGFSFSQNAKICFLYEGNLSKLITSGLPLFPWNHQKTIGFQREYPFYMFCKVLNTAINTAAKHMLNDYWWALKSKGCIGTKRAMPCVFISISFFWLILSAQRQLFSFFWIFFIIRFTDTAIAKNKCCLFLRFSKYTGYTEFLFYWKCSLSRLLIYAMNGNNTTLKIDFTELTKKMKSLAQSFWYTGSEMIHLSLMNLSSPFIK